MYCNDGTIRGYINRSIPNLITKDMQGEVIERLDPQQTLTSIGA